MEDDNTLLRRYVEEGSQDPFTELVHRHVALVYTAALRRTYGDSHRAADVAQQVFTQLARRARRLLRHPTLSGWLYTATRNAAINLMRAEQRWARREQEAQNMQTLTSELGSEASWDKLRPILDSVMDQLGETDRATIILRFFEKRSFNEIGRALNLTDNTARMRTERALDKLRVLFARRGLVSSATALAVVLGTQGVSAAPAGLAASFASAALAGAADLGGGSAWVHAFLVMNKINTGIAGGLLLVGITTALLELQANRALSAEITVLQAVHQDGVVTPTTLPKENSEAAELISLRNHLAQLRGRPPGVTDGDMKPMAEWRNAGRATPAAALETIMWALSTRDLDTIAASLDGERDQAILETWFSGLPESVRAKYGTPQRLLAPLAGSLSPVPKDSVVAYEVINQQSDHGPETVRMNCWEKLASGKEVQAKIDLARTPGGTEGWHLIRTGPGMTAAEWQSMVFSQIDPATGEVIPRSQP